MIHLELQLQAREEDRIEVAVSLSPQAGDDEVDGVALQLQCPKRNPLGPRLLLPFSGAIDKPTTTVVELRATHSHVPDGSQVIATAWRQGEQVEVKCCVDARTNLQRHLTGSPLCMPDSSGVEINSVEPVERQALLRHLPWIADWKLPGSRIVDTHDLPDAQEIASQLGLDPDNAAWLDQLLSED